MLGRMFALLLFLLAAMSALPARGMEVNAPGPSAELFKHPYYLA